MLQIVLIALTTFGAANLYTAIGTDYQPNWQESELLYFFENFACAMDPTLKTNDMVCVGTIFQDYTPYAFAYFVDSKI